tara:strand:+ start:260 stop:526 length:267 start_codon:yes stop_codon:yes gene_type:complete
MNTIHKFKIEPAASFNNISLPFSAHILNVEFQNNELFMWANIDTSEPKETRRFEVFLTGQEMPEMFAYVFIGTAHKDGFVFHLFEAFR